MNTVPVWHRYNRSGPRYTSYPTAVHFSESFELADYVAQAAISKAQHKPLSLYIHLPFCSHICYYCACNKIVTKHQQRSVPYLDHLFKEIELVAHHYGEEQVVEQIHFGGGTPTFFTTEQLAALMAKIRQHFTVAPQIMTDISIEIDPRTVDWSTMYALQTIGFNRISIGVQDTNTLVQQAINRVQSTESVQSIIDAARAMAFNSIHMDLIYGLPHQSVHSFLQTVEQVIEMAPDRLSLFNYAHLPHRFKTQRRMNAKELPTPEVKLAILERAHARLLSAGYVHIGMDHFALPDDALAIAQEQGELHRNFQGYTTHGHCELLGLGVSAISQVGEVYVQNTTDELQYYRNINSGQLPFVKGLRLSHDDAIRQAVIKQLMCHGKVICGDIERQFMIKFDHYFYREICELETMVDEGLVRWGSDGCLSVLPLGKLLIRNICMVFDDYLRQPIGGEDLRYSSVV